MKIIYHCFGGAHSSVLAAALHLNLLDRRRIPTRKDLSGCPHFDEQGSKEAGKIFFMGRDEKGHEIFFMGCRNSGRLVETVLEEFCRLVGLETNELLMVNTVGCLNVFLKVGGFLSRGLGLVTLGQLFLFPGAKIAFPRIRAIVHSVKEKL